MARDRHAVLTEGFIGKYVLLFVSESDTISPQGRDEVRISVVPAFNLPLRLPRL